MNKEELDLKMILLGMETFHAQCPSSYIYISKEPSSNAFNTFFWYNPEDDKARPYSVQFKEEWEKGATVDHRFHTFEEAFDFFIKHVKI